jgi:hypothetical protein
MTPEQMLIDLLHAETIAPRQFDPSSAIPFANLFKPSGVRSGVRHFLLRSSGCSSTPPHTRNDTTGQVVTTARIVRRLSLAEELQS